MRTEADDSAKERQTDKEKLQAAPPVTDRPPCLKTVGAAVHGSTCDYPAGIDGAGDVC